MPTTPAAAPPPRVGVVIAAFEAERFLAFTLDSLLAQTFCDWQAVVVDDGSTDGTAETALWYAELDDRIRVLQQPNGGSSRARNAGVAALPDTTPYVAFLDADDTWLPDTLAVLVAHLSGPEEVVGAYGLAEYMDASGRPLLPGLHPMRQRDRRRMGRFDLARLGSDQPYTFASMFISGTLWPASVALHRRDVFELVGGFDPALRQLQDWELYLRMSRHGPFLPVDRQVAWYRQHDANITKRSERVAYYSLLVRWNAWRSPDNTERQRQQNKRIWRRLTARWLARSAVAEVFAWRRKDLPVAVQAVRAVRLFATALLRGHPDKPDERAVELLETFVTGADREGRRDAVVAARSADSR